MEHSEQAGGPFSRWAWGPRKGSNGEQPVMERLSAEAFHVDIATLKKGGSNRAKVLASAPFSGAKSRYRSPEISFRGLRFLGLSAAPRANPSQVTARGFESR